MPAVSFCAPDEQGHFQSAQVVHFKPPYYLVSVVQFLICAFTKNIRIKKFLHREVTSRSLWSNFLIVNLKTFADPSGQFFLPVCL
jgi:hypothetical protein